MSDNKPMIIPTIHYRDVAAAVDWLCNAFGFERHLVVPGENGGVMHAELVYRNGMVMLGANSGHPYDDLLCEPGDRGVTQAPFLVVDDPDAHCAVAKAAGAEIVIELQDHSYGSREYSCRDPEGHIWNFGTYNPWAPQTNDHGENTG